ncbi:hypothetical protein [Pseudomonas putida]|uniref:hypothetical protein n=1 Tax=Pseudomonas putida TaxID=303 RepID=UPI0035716EA9
MPTENRSSNTQKVSVPPYIGLEPLVGRYYPAQCRRCGWVGSSEELTEDDAQCTRDIGDRLCLGDCDELERHDLLNIIQAMAAPHPHPEPIAWMVDTAFWWTKEEAERDAAATGLLIVGLGPMTTTAEVERLRANAGQHKLEMDAACGELEILRAQLAEAQALLREIHDGALSGFARYSKIEEFLSASAEPSARVEIDERAEFDAWFKDHSKDWPFPSESIKCIARENDWIVWQARAALERKPS